MRIQYLVHVSEGHGESRKIIYSSILPLKALIFLLSFVLLNQKLRMTKVRSGNFIMPTLSDLQMMYRKQMYDIYSLNFSEIEKG